MSKYKKTYKLYTAWNYEQEVEDLNAASKMGWKLINKTFIGKLRGNILLNTSFYGIIL